MDLDDILGGSELSEEIIKEFMKDRCIIINKNVSTRLLEEACLYILKFNKEDRDIPVGKRKPIKIILNSDGGDAVAGMNLIDIMMASKTKIITIGFGNCYSMAAYLLIAGHERICFKNTVVLIHDGQTGYVASSNKGRDIQNFYNALDDRISEMVVSKTNMTKEYLVETKDRELYMFADEAKEKGILDKIIGEDVDLDYVF